MAEPVKRWPCFLLVGCCLAGGWFTAGCAGRPTSASVPIPADQIEIRQAETEPADGLEIIGRPTRRVCPPDPDSHGHRHGVRHWVVAYSEVSEPEAKRPIPNRLLRALHSSPSPGV